MGHRRGWPMPVNSGVRCVAQRCHSRAILPNDPFTFFSLPCRGKANLSSSVSGRFYVTNGPSTRRPFENASFDSFASAPMLPGPSPPFHTPAAWSFSNPSHSTFGLLQHAITTRTTPACMIASSRSSAASVGYRAQAEVKRAPRARSPARNYVNSLFD